MPGRGPITPGWNRRVDPRYIGSVLDSLSHVIVAVSDLEAATEDYRAILGRDPSWRGEHPGHGTANTLFGLGNGYLELVARIGEGIFGDGVRDHLESRGEGLLGFALSCEDADAYVALLRDRGFGASDPMEGSGRSGDRERFWRNIYLPPDQTRGVFLFAIEHRDGEVGLPPAQATGEEDAAPHEFDHLVVMTRDPDACRSFYEEGLGLRMALDRTFEKFGSRLIFFRVGGVSIEIGASLSEAVDPEAPDHLWGLAYRVRDLAAARERVAAAGIDASEVRKGRKKGTVVCTVRRPTHGVATLLIGPDPEGG